MTDDYSATTPAALPAYHKGRPTEYRKTLTTACVKCPKCGRPTYITATDDLRAPYDKLGCFHTLCGHLEP